MEEIRDIIREVISEGSGIYETIICSAFPGTGKSYFFKNTKRKVLDSDSSTFDKDDFPNNYMEHIKEKIGHVDIIFISSHKEVRDALVENGLEFNLVYPDKALKEEYVERYKERGSPQAFIDLLDKNWDSWMDELAEQEGCKHFVLQKGKFISDILDIEKGDE